jgi:hypothetical protein
MRSLVRSLTLYALLGSALVLGACWEADNNTEPASDDGGPSGNDAAAVADAGDVAANAAADAAADVADVAGPDDSSVASDATAGPDGGPDAALDAANGEPAAYATVNMAITVQKGTAPALSGTITRCNVDDGATFLGFDKQKNGTYRGHVECIAVGANITDTVAFTLVFFDTSVGTNTLPLAYSFQTDSYVGTGLISGGYTAPMTQGVVGASTGLFASGTGGFTLDAFDTATGRFKASVDAAYVTTNDVSATIKGTIEGKLPDCTGQPWCN